MNKFKLALVVVLFSSFQINAQWYLQNPTNQMHDFFDVYFFNESIGWVVGYNGMIMKTEDGGANWNIQFNQTNYSFNSVVFIDSLTGFVAGNGTNNNGIIYKTTNGGNLWIELSIPGVQSLNAIYFFNSNLGYAVGQNGKILKSSDGGSQWYSIPTGTIGFFNDIVFSDSTNGFVLDLFDRLGVTSDAGESWNFNDLFTGHDLYSLSLLNSTSVVITGFEIILKSTDGGMTWQSSNPPFQLFSSCFTDSLTGFTVGRDGAVLKTLDGGYTWDVISFGEMNSLKSIVKTTDDVLFVAGKSSTIGKTTDLGNTWIQLMEDIFDYLPSVCFLDSLNGFIAGSARLLKTIDGGTNWNSISFGIINQLNDVYMLDKDNIYFVGDAGIYGSTNDAGQNWDVNQIINEDFTGVVFTTPSTGIIVSEYGLILKTSNGGINWDTVYQDNNSFTFNSIDFLDIQNGVVVGCRYDGVAQAHYSIVLFTYDGGDTWQPRYLNDCLADVQILDINKIIAVGSFEIPNFLGVIYISTNGGNTWSSNYSNNSLFRGLYFFDQMNGYVTDVLNGRIKRTNDGGVTWVNQYTLPLSFLTDIYFVDHINGWAVGSNGTILHTTNGGVTFIEDERFRNVQATEFTLSQNYPNPFNPSTIISYELPAAGDVSLKVYDVLGREVVTLVNEYKNAGSYEVEFKSTVGSRQLANGVYLYRLQVGDYVETKKMLLIK